MLKIFNRCLMIAVSIAPLHALADPNMPAPPNTDVSAVFTNAVNNNPNTPVPPGSAGSQDAQFPASNKTGPALTPEQINLIKQQNSPTAAAPNNDFGGINETLQAGQNRAFSQLQQLQQGQQQIQHNLSLLHEQNAVLQQRLSEINQQISLSIQQRPLTPQDLQQLQQLQMGQQQIQNDLIILNQQDLHLQQRLNQLNQQITQLRQTLAQQAQPAALTQPNTNAGQTAVTTVAAAPAPLGSAMQVAPPTPIQAPVAPIIQPSNNVPLATPAPQQNAVTTVTPSANPMPIHAPPANTAVVAVATQPPATAPITLNAQQNTAAIPPHPVATAASRTGLTQPVNHLPAHNAVAKPAVTAPSNTAESPVKSAIGSITAPITTSPSALHPANAQHTSPRVEAAKTKLMHWAEDPAILLRVGGGFIVLALLLLIGLLWPKTKKIKRQPNPRPLEPSVNNSAVQTQAIIENTYAAVKDPDISAEYDFMSSDDAIPIRLDLARAYLEMGKYQEAREAIDPVFERGNNSQHEEAKHVLRQIAIAQAKVTV